MKWILLIIVFSLYSEVFSQNFIKRSSVGSCGSSIKVNVNGKTALIRQSIGQASIIGTSKNKNYTLIQGFQQPLLSAISDPVIEEDKLKGALFPNPFGNLLEVKFDEKIENNLLISIYDVSGKIKFSKTQSAAQHIQLNLSSMQNGEYFLKIKCKNKTFTSKIIKN